MAMADLSEPETHNNHRHADRSASSSPTPSSPSSSGSTSSSSASIGSSSTYTSQSIDSPPSSLLMIPSASKTLNTVSRRFEKPNNVMLNDGVDMDSRNHSRKPSLTMADEKSIREASSDHRSGFLQDFTDHHHHHHRHLANIAHKIPEKCSSCAAGVAADCTAVCCCPLAILRLLSFVVIDIPSRMAKSVANRVRRLRLRRSLTLSSSSTGSSRTFTTSWSYKETSSELMYLPKPEAIRFDNELLLNHFQAENLGFL